MDNLTIFVIISIFLIICLSKLYIVYFRNNLEHLTSTSTNVVQELSSFYNTDKLNVNKVQLGDKWVLSGVGDPTANDDTLRFYKADGSALGKIGVSDMNTKTIKTGKIQLGDKWLLSGVGDASSNDDWLRLYKTDGTNAYYGGLATGRLYDARIGDMQTVQNGLQGGINALNSSLALISGVKDNTRCIDGYDLTGEFVTNGIDDCGNQCRSRYSNNAMCAQLRKSDGHCWCKSVLGLVNGPDTNFTAKLMP